MTTTAICDSTVATLYTDSSAHEPDATAISAAVCKIAKDCNLGASYTFCPVAVKTLDPLNDNTSVTVSSWLMYVSNFW